LGKIEATRHKVREMVGISFRHRTEFIHYEGIGAVISQLTGAVMRAILVMAMIATPSVLLPDIGADGKQMVALIALFGGALTLVEYSATYPGLIEFRYAPPFNRVRFLSLFATVFLLTIMARGHIEPSTLSQLVNAIGTVIGHALDFPYSPVRLATLMLPLDARPEQIEAALASAGLSYLISLLSLVLFVMLLKVFGWPSRAAAFNVWVNLPTFEPTSGGDVVDRLDRDARINIALGFLLPFLVPPVVKIAAIGFQPISFSSPQTLIWTMAAWAFLPASLFMRGIAMRRIADMIRVKRRQNGLPLPGVFAAA
jgi:hypothetical protein